MKKREIENQAKSVLANIKNQIESNPVPAFLIGIVIGAALVVLKGLITPVVFLAALIGIVLYALADSDNVGAESDDITIDTIKDPDEPSKANGSSHTQSH